MMRQCKIVLVLVFVGLGLCSCRRPEEVENNTELGGVVEMAAGKLHSFVMNDIDGKPVKLSKYQGKVVLVVNVASKCGYTKQYGPLEELYNKYKGQGLVILGFPANNFLKQEPGSDAEIKEFCTTKFNVTFPMFSKISVKGKNIHPLYAYLTDKKENAPFGGQIKWNFNKFLFDKAGKTIARYPSDTDPLDKVLIGDIEKALAE